MARRRRRAHTGKIQAGLVVLVIALIVIGYQVLHKQPDHPASSSSPKPPSATPAATVAGAGGAARPVAGPGPQSAYHFQPQPAAGSCHFVIVNASTGQYLPDRHCTPGATNPKATQANLASTVCKSGYTATIRPPTSITSREKKASDEAYGFTGKDATTEYDHLVSLELGGDPNSPLNLWPEPNKAHASSISNPKDVVENKLKTLVCNAVHGKPYLPLTRAQYLIATNWTTAIATAQGELVS